MYLERNTRIGVAAVVVATAATLILAQPGAPPGQSAPAAPEDFAPGHTRRCEIVGGQVDSYRILTDAGQILEIAVEQRGVDLEIILRDPEGARRAQADGLLADAGTERILYVTALPGYHTLEVRAFPTTSTPEGQEPPPRCYEARLAPLRRATDLDHRRARAAWALSQARQLQAPASIPALEEAVALWLEIEEPPWQAAAWNALALAHPPERKERREALRAILALGDTIAPDQRAGALAELGRLLYHIDRRPEEAHLPMTEAWKIWSGLHGTASWRSYTAAHLGAIHKQLDEPHLALRYLEDSVRHAQMIADGFLESRSRHNRARLYYFYARWNAAASDLDRAIAIEQAALDRGERWTSPQSLADSHVLRAYVAIRQGHFLDANRQITLARDLQATDMPYHRATNLLAWAWVYHQTWLAGRSAPAYPASPGQARSAYLEALRIFRDHGTRREEAVALLRLGFLDHDIARRLEQPVHYRAAQRQLEEALLIFRQVGDQAGESEARWGLARTLRALEQLDAALEQARQAVEIAESLRAQPEETELRAFLLEAKRHIFDLYIDLLVEKGSDAAIRQALSVSETARARAVNETLAASRVDLRGGPGLLLQDARRLRRLRVAATLRGDHSVAKAARLELEHLEPQLQSTHPRHVGLSDPRPRRAAEIQRDLLDKDTLLLEYYLGADHSYLWVVSPSAIHTFKLPSAADLELAAARTHSYVSQPLVRPAELLDQELMKLGELLLRPARHLLKGQRLLIVADGALQYVPFAALPLEQRPRERLVRLIERHEIIILPSATTLAVLRQGSRAEATSEGTIALVDPIYTPDDNRLSCRSQRSPEPGAPSRAALSRLPHTRLEAEEIRTFDRATQIKEGGHANKEQLRGATANAPRIHIATHAKLDDEHPWNSSLVLSLLDRDCSPQEGYLPLREVYDLRLKAELVVLSACQTALGGHIRGEGLNSLALGFLYAGADRVVATLWSVADAATADLMGRFYDNLLTRGMRPAQALRAAQLNFLESDGKHAMPFYWAGFVIQGDF